MEVPFPSGELAAAEEERKNLSLRPEGGGETGIMVKQKKKKKDR